MSWIAAAIVGSNIVGGMISSHGAQAAADTQAQAAQNATNAQLQMFNQNKSDVYPWIQAGQGSLAQLTQGTAPGGAFTPTTYGQQQQLTSYGGGTPTLEGTRGTANFLNLGGAPAFQNVRMAPDLATYAQYNPTEAYQGRGDFTTDKFKADPGYQFQLQQGQNALTNAASLSGGMNSNNLKGLLGYSQGLADTTYQTAFNRYQTEAGRSLNEYQTNLQDKMAQFGLQTNITGLNNQNITQNLANQMAATGFNNANAQRQFEDSAQQNEINNRLAQQQYQNQVAGTQMSNANAQQMFQNQLQLGGLNNQVIAANNAANLTTQQLNNANAQQQFANLAALSQAGQNAAVGVGNQGVQVGGQIGSNIIGAGNAQAAGQIGSANAISGAIGQGYNQYLQSQFMNNMGGFSPNALGAGTSQYSSYAPTAVAQGGWGIE